MKNDLLDVYYDLYEILGSIETVADALKELQGVNMCRSGIIGHLESYRLHHVEQELNDLYDMKLDDLKKFKIKHIAMGTQMTIYDVLGEVE